MAQWDQYLEFLETRPEAYSGAQTASNTKQNWDGVPGKSIKMGVLFYNNGLYDVYFGGANVDLATKGVPVAPQGSLQLELSAGGFVSFQTITNGVTSDIRWIAL